MANTNTTTTAVLSPNYAIKIHKWKVREGFQVNNNQLILLYELINSADKEIKRFKSTKCGVVKKRYHKEGDIVDGEKPLLELTDCIHATVIKDMCADCGADLRQEENANQSEASVPMVHSVPELKVSHELAQELGKADTVRLLKDRKLVLLVDLDQTVIHTTNDNVPNNLKGVYHFQLYGPNSPWYHTRLRPGTFPFLENIAPYFELHICTFGARNYAHTIAQFLDEDGKYFSHRILSRDECLSFTYKTDNLRALFPCGDSMVCIIDDREDVWNMATNLIQVKPYHFFQHTGDINAPPGMSKHELDGKGVDFSDLETKSNKTQAANKRLEEDELKEKTESVQIDVEKVDEINKTPKKDDEDSEVCNTDESEEISNKSTETIASSEPSSEKPIDATTSMSIDDNNEEVDSSSEVGKQKENSSDSTSKLVVINNEENSTGEDNLIDIDDPDDYLLYLETILLKIHSRFYAHYDETKQIPDLKTLIPKIRSEVLVGKTLVFSGLVPNQIKLEKSRAYLIARSLGANVIQQLTDETTHLVASTAGTFKVNAARKNAKIHIVSPDWLWTCAERWECVEEKLFPIDSRKASKTRQPPAHCHSPEHVVNYSGLSDLAASSSEPSSSNADDSTLKFIDTINPLLKFSNDAFEAMNEDFKEFYESDSGSDESVDIENPPMDKNLRKRKREEEEEEAKRKIFHPADVEKLPEFEKESSGSSSSSNSGSEDESPVEKFRRGCDLPSDLDMGSNDGSANSSSGNDDQGDDGDWNMMGAALEREFLGLD